MAEKENPATPTEVMARHYLIAALWTQEEDLKGSTDLSAEAKETARSECAEFLKRAQPLLKAVGEARGYGSHPDCGTEYPTFAAMGHDLWLTRNRHGCGFWDRTELCAVQLAKDSNLGDSLSDVAREMGEQTVYLGDDGLVHIG